uniref:Uncharacterized protein n=1 Tax=Panagrolaimus sp. JU765 TaxID=591449 RepID=A0AC34PV84_9BILA
MFDAVFLAAHSVFNLSQLYPLKNEVNYARCRSMTAAPIPFHYGKKLINHIFETTLTGLTDWILGVKVGREREHVPRLQGSTPKQRASFGRVETAFSSDDDHGTALRDAEEEPL